MPIQKLFETYSVKSLRITAFIFLVIAMAITLARTESHAVTMQKFAASADQSIASAQATSAPTTPSAPTTTTDPTEAGSVHAYTSTFIEFAKSSKGKACMIAFWVIGGLIGLASIGADHDLIAQYSPGFKGYPVTQAVFHDIKAPASN